MRRLISLYVYVCACARVRACVCANIENKTINYVSMNITYHVRLSFKFLFDYIRHILYLFTALYH